MISLDIGYVAIFVFVYTLLLYACFENIYLAGRKNKDCDKYKKQIKEQTQALQKKNSIIKGQGKGMQKIQRKNSKLQKENECLKRKLCKE